MLECENVYVYRYKKNKYQFKKMIKIASELLKLLSQEQSKQNFTARLLKTSTSLITDSLREGRGGTEKRTYF